MRLSDVRHQQRAQDRLQRALHSGRTPHAYLFTGPDGVGKEMLARRFAGLLLCDAPRETEAPPTVPGGVSTWREACGRCTACDLMAADTHPDYHLIHRLLIKMHADATIRRRKAVELGVDVVRQFLIAKVGLRPALGRAKVFVVAEAERLSPSAQNALLKTLEEPPPHSYLILLAASADPLLETIRSRCHEIAFQCLPAEFIRDRLIAEQRLEPAAATFLAEAAQGSLGAARRFLRYGLHELLPELTASLEGVGRDPLRCAKALADRAKALGLAISAGVTSEDDDEAVDVNSARLAQRMLLATVATVLRDVQRVVVGRPPAALPDSPLIERLAGRTHPRAIGEAIRAVGAAEYQIEQNANTQLIFDALCIALGRGLFPGLEAAAG